MVSSNYTLANPFGTVNINSCVIFLKIMLCFISGATTDNQRKIVHKCWFNWRIQPGDSSVAMNRVKGHLFLYWLLKVVSTLPLSWFLFLVLEDRQSHSGIKEEKNKSILMLPLIDFFFRQIGLTFLPVV